jgi:glycosyltransferase involved in cell wall biosynthesis
MTMKNLISIITPCFNEIENIDELCDRIKSVMVNCDYNYEHIVIDNHSTDGTINRLKSLAEKDSRIKVIINARNFGHTKSPYYALLQSKGDAVVLIASDLQDPPELIPDFIKHWEKGFKIVLAIKPSSDESRIMFFIRKIYYSLITKISDVALVKNATGAGLFDAKVIEILRKIEDPNPYFRGLLCEIGYPIATIPFNQPARKKGITKNNFFTLYDLAVLGITNHSKLPIRLMAMCGFLLSFVSIIVATIFLILKLMYWNSFQLGTAPILIGIFFFAAIQTFCLGVLGEYIGSIHSQVRKMPLVVEQERINF